ncbi:murein biosynthesis integral membrane protein MurJ, partial [Candidatus Sumerlaeota bacterium]|nr:murein biosynthesis integral membrane protein MurJ [Candidatus Sumerlaeota bacterium]
MQGYFVLPTLRRQAYLKVMSEQQSIVRSAGLIGIITMFSRILGVVRDAVIAGVLGAGYINDCFQIAFEIPHLTRRVLGEGALSAFIVPVYTKRQHQSGQESAWRFVSNALNVFFLFTFLLTVLGVFFSGYIFSAFGGLKYIVKGELQYLHLGTTLTKIMFPYVLFLALASLIMGVLHSHRHFTTPALGSVVLNLSIIFVGLVFIRFAPEKFVYVLAIAVMLGAVVRVGIMIPPLLKRGFHYVFIINLKDPQLVELIKMMLPALFGLAIVQLNILVDLNFANWMGPGTPTYIRFSNRLIQFPLALFAASLSTAVLPSLSKKVITNDVNELRTLINYTINLIIVIFLPATVGLLVLGHPIIEILFERGRWTAIATGKTYYALIFYSLGLLPIAIHRLLTPVYYARQDLITPVKSASVALIANILLNFIFFYFTNMRQGGLA